MMWIDYGIYQYPDGSLKVEGDTPTEAIDKGLYKPGDVFVVNEHGVLRKTTFPLTVIENDQPMLKVVE